MSLYRLYNKFDAFAHDTFRKRFSKSYSTTQYNDAKCHIENWKSLSPEQKKKIQEFWGMRNPVKSDYYTHEIMLNVTGDFDVRYCPEKIYRLYLDPTLGNRNLLWAWDDKNYFERHQPSVPFPYTYVRNVNGYFLDHNYLPITQEEAKRIMVENLPLIVKPSLKSGEGKNIRMISDESAVDEILATYKNDYLLQEVLVQCDEFSKMSSNCVNAIRIVTAIVNGESKLLSSMLLCNTTDSIACNSNSAPGKGVVVIGIDEDGKLLDTGYYENAQSLQVLPNGFVFGGLQVPSYKKAVEIALEAHSSMPMLGFIGWDITIDKNKKPICIEWNLRGIGMYHQQLAMGPFFAEYTDYFADMSRNLIKNWRK